MSYIIQEILKKRKITDYLKSKGISPVGNEVNGRLKYKCPLHAGDNTPSFTVYKNGGFENFFCFGCKRKYHIVHLYRDLEKVSIKDAIKALSDGLSLDLNSEIEYVIKEIEEDKSISYQFTPIDFSLIISRQLYDFLKIVDKNPDDTIKIERLFQAIDDAVDRCDLNSLKDTYDYLETALVKRVRYYEEEKEKKERMYARISGL